MTNNNNFSSPTIATKELENAQPAHEGESPVTVESNFASLPEISKVIIEDALEYNPEIFAEAEMEQEIESWMTNNDFYVSAEALTANEAEQEIEKYAQKMIIATEEEPTLKVEAWMTDENFWVNE